MGFFKSFVNKIGRGVGKVLEKAGEVTNILGLEIAGMNLQDSCSDIGKAIGNEDVFIAEEARIEDTSRLNATLTEFTLMLEKKADLVEDKIITESNKYMKAIIDEVKDGNIELDINIDRIEYTSKKIEEMIRGNIKKYLSKRVSIDDLECSKILKMEAGKLKEVNMLNLSKDILKEAIAIHIKDIKNLVNSQNKILKDTILERVNDFKITTERHVEGLEKFEVVRNNDGDIEELRDIHSDIIMLCNKCEEYLSV